MEVLQRADIDAQSIAFFLNMYKAFTRPWAAKTPNAGDDCGYNAGYGIPDQIKSVSYPDGPTGLKVVINFTTKENLTGCSTTNSARFSHCPTHGT